MLRGPQTPGQLRARSGRLYAFDDLAEVDATLREMAAGEAPLAVELERRPGTKESRWAHLLGAEPDERAEPPAPARPLAAAEEGLSERVAALEGRVEELTRELARLREELGS